MKREQEENAYVRRLLMRLQEHDLRTNSKFKFSLFFGINATKNRAMLEELSSHGTRHDQATAKRILKLLDDKE